MDYESALWEIVQATVVANVSGVAIGDANRSRTDGQRCRLCNLKHKRNGIFHLTVEFFYAEHIQLSGHAGARRECADIAAGRCDARVRHRQEALSPSTCN